MKIRLLLVDDHAVVRSGLRMLLGTESDVEIIGEAGTAAEAFTSASDLQPDVILMDIGLPDKTGIEATREIKSRFPNMAIVALTIHEDEEYFFKMLEAGASGYVPKRAAPDELLTAIRAAANGEVYLYPTMAKLLVRDFLISEPMDKDRSASKDLTDREQEVLQRVKATRRSPRNWSSAQKRWHDTVRISCTSSICTPALNWCVMPSARGSSKPDSQIYCHI